MRTIAGTTPEDVTHDEPAPAVVVNGVPRPLSGVPAHTNLLDFIRSTGLTGAKEGCAEGECGACSVLVARPDVLEENASRWVALNACLVPAAAYDGQEIVTAEGLGDPRRLHPVQAALARAGGSQCGYCTPGFVCSMAAEFYRPDRRPGEVTDEHGPNGFDLHSLSGNLCRCTGYRPIRDAAYELAEPAADDDLAHRCHDPAPAPGRTLITEPDGRFVRPADLGEVLDLLAAEPQARLVAGSTDWGVDVNIKGTRVPLVVAIDRVAQLRTFTIGEDRIELGAALTLSECERLLAGRVPLLDEMFPQFASRLIRNGGTFGGNLGTGSPIGDSPPALLALEAVLVLASREGEREVPLAGYFTGYRQTVRRPGELIRAVRIPLPLARVTGFHKIAKRRFDDISSVAVGFALDITDGMVTRARIGLGGVAATPLRALATEAALEGRPWTAGTVERAAAVLAGEGTPLDDHRASAAYRSAMLGQALRKLAHRSGLDLRQQATNGGVA